MGERLYNGFPIQGWRILCEATRKRNLVEVPVTVDELEALLNYIRELEKAMDAIIELDTCNEYTATIIAKQALKGTHEKSNS
jgi:hypothetical protein